MTLALCFLREIGMRLLAVDDDEGEVGESSLKDGGGVG